MAGETDRGGPASAGEGFLIVMPKTSWGNHRWRQTRLHAKVEVLPAGDEKDLPRWLKVDLPIISSALIFMAGLYLTGYWLEGFGIDPFQYMSGGDFLAAAVNPARYLVIQLLVVLIALVVNPMIKRLGSKVFGRKQLGASVIYDVSDAKAAYMAWGYAVLMLAFGLGIVAIGWTLHDSFWGIPHFYLGSVMVALGVMFLVLMVFHTKTFVRAHWKTLGWLAAMASFLFASFTMGCYDANRLNTPVVVTYTSTSGKPFFGGQFIGRLGDYVFVKKGESAVLQIHKESLESLTFLMKR